MKHIYLAELSRDGGPIFAGLQFATPWLEYNYWALDPGAVRPIPDQEEDCEQGFVLLGGPAELTVGSFRKVSDETRGVTGTSSRGPGYIVGPVGYDCKIQNLSDQAFGVFHVKVAMNAEQMGAVARDSFRDAFMQTGAFNQTELKWRDAIHGGCGKIATRHVLEPEDFRSDWIYLDHAVLEEESSVGYHYHDTLEESFVLLGGRGLMTTEDETFKVSQGSVTWQGIGQAHGIYNPGPEPLEFVRVAVLQRDEKTTTIDLNDDLSARAPS